jgi:7,8-dihydro-6-hydroxymethylpterin dimethyltransferase
MLEAPVSERATLVSRLDRIREDLLTLDASDASHRFELKSFDKLWKSTIGLCPTCLAHVPALVYETDGRVFLRKYCDAHGFSDAVIENDARYYNLSNKDRWGRRYAVDSRLDFPFFREVESGRAICGESGFEFADQSANKTCTVLVEVTDACNLACSVCYSDARGDRKLPLEAFKQHICALLAEKTVLDSVQITGGEAVLHPQFWEMVAFLHDTPGVKKIYLPSNGIEFSKIEVAGRLKSFADKVMVLLQFDGAQAESNRKLRNANPSEIRQRVIENLGAIGIHMQLTMTITLGVNDHEIGWAIEMGMRHGHVKVVALQPVTYSGRYDLAQDPMNRLTLSDVIKRVTAQIQGGAQDTDFHPIPCSHPNCGWITLYARRFGMKVNIARHIDLARVTNQVANRTLLNTGELRGAIGSADPGVLRRAGEWIGKRLIRSTDVFAVAIKPFMDRFNYDQDRISACCHHLLDTRGRPVSFCEYNARLRVADSWRRFPTLAE